MSSINSIQIKMHQSLVSALSAERELDNEIDELHEVLDELQVTKHAIKLHTLIMSKPSSKSSSKHTTPKYYLVGSETAKHMKWKYYTNSLSDKLSDKSVYEIISDVTHTLDVCVYIKTMTDSSIITTNDMQFSINEFNYDNVAIIEDIEFDIEDNFIIDTDNLSYYCKQYEHEIKNNCKCESYTNNYKTIESFFTVKCLIIRPKMPTIS